MSYEKKRLGKIIVHVSCCVLKFVVNMECEDDVERASRGANEAVRLRVSALWLFAKQEERRLGRLISRTVAIRCFLFLVFGDFSWFELLKCSNVGQLL